MAGILFSTHQPNPAFMRPEPHRPGTTALVLDESEYADGAALSAMVGDGSGPVAILITRLPVSPCVLGMGAGPESMLLWHDFQRAWVRAVVDCDNAVQLLTTELRDRGLGPIEQIDCFPRWHPLRRTARREVESVVRSLEQLRPARIVIDPTHRLAADLAAGIERSRSLHAH